MKYLDLVEVCEKVEGTTKGLEKTSILAGFLDKLKKEKDKDIIYLLQGRVFADYDERELGMSQQLVIKALNKATGISSSEIIKEFKKLGDLGKVAEKIMGKKRQSALFSKKLTAEKVLGNLRKLPSLVGKGTVGRKIGLVVELLHSASGKEAKYIVRTVMGDLKIAVGSSSLYTSPGNCSGSYSVFSS